MSEITKTFKYLRYWIAVLLALSVISFLNGCATAGYEGVDTTRKAVLVATAEVREANRLLQNLIQRNAIPDDDAENVLDSLREAHGVLSETLRLVDLNGDPTTVETNLAKANVAIGIALSLLANFNEDP